MIHINRLMESMEQKLNIPVRHHQYSGDNPNYAVWYILNKENMNWEDNIPKGTVITVRFSVYSLESDLCADEYFQKLKELLLQENAESVRFAGDDHDEDDGGPWWAEHGEFIIII